MLSEISGSDRDEILKSAGFRFELWGTSADEAALGLLKDLHHLPGEFQELAGQVSDVGTGPMGALVEPSDGAATIGVNYYVPGSEPAYVYAMAEKRAKDRVILKLIGLPDVVSSEEPHSVESSPSSSNENAPAELDLEPGMVVELKRKLDGAETVEAVIALMRSADTHQSLAEIAPAWRDEVRAYAKDRLVALGWTPKQAA